MNSISVQDLQMPLCPVLLGRIGVSDSQLHEG